MGIGIFGGVPIFTWKFVPRVAEVVATATSVSVLIKGDLAELDDELTISGPMDEFATPGFFPPNIDTICR